MSNVSQGVRREWRDGTLAFNPSTTIPTSCAALTRPIARTARILSSSSAIRGSQASPGRVSRMVVIRDGGRMSCWMRSFRGFAMDWRGRAQSARESREVRGDTPCGPGTVRQSPGYTSATRISAPRHRTGHAGTLIGSSRASRGGSCLTTGGISWIRRAERGTHVDGLVEGDVVWYSALDWGTSAYTSAVNGKTHTLRGLPPRLTSRGRPSWFASGEEGRRGQQIAEES
jgi:hypothetical protein